PPTVIIWLDLQDGSYLPEWNFTTNAPDHEDSFEFRLEAVPNSSDYIIIPYLALPTPSFRAGQHPQNAEESIHHDGLHCTACRKRGCFVHAQIKNNSRWCKDDHRNNYY